VRKEVCLYSDIDSFYYCQYWRVFKKKLVPDKYIHKDSNIARNKTKECLWEKLLNIGKDW